MKKGVFITLEGGEGTGKSTQIKLLHQALIASGVDVLTTREPGGTPQAERIRALLLQRDSGSFDPLTEALLMFSARREHLVNKIWPALKAGQWVVSDRFADSSRVFQGVGMGVPAAQIEELYKMVAGDFVPDLTLIFDIDPELGLSRSLRQMQMTFDKMESTEDRYERMGLPFHRRLREGFLALARAHKDRCVVIDAAQPLDVVHAQVLKAVADHFGVAAKAVRVG